MFAKVALPIATMGPVRKNCLCFLLAAVAVPVAALPGWAAGTTERVSLGPGEVVGDAGGYAPSISADGRLVAFVSLSTNLVPGDTNGWADVFVRDRLASRTERVSVSTSGAQGHFWATTAAISPDGRFVAFGSAADNLVAGDTNGWTDVFVRDRQTGQTERVSLSTSGAQADGNSASGGFSRAAVSAGGRFVAFDSVAGNLVRGDRNSSLDVFVRDRRSGRTELVSVGRNGVPGRGASFGPSISADGRFVAFVSYASTLVPDDTNDDSDVFVRDRESGRTERVSVGPGGVQGTGGSRLAVSISAEGRFVAFRSAATNLVPGSIPGGVFVRDRQTRRTELVSIGADGAPRSGGNAAISPGGRFVAFESDMPDVVPGDTNGVRDIFVRDRQLRVTSRVSVGSADRQGNGASTSPSISAGGRFVSFASRATNLVAGDAAGGVFVRAR